MRSQRGIALVVALILAVLLSLIGLSLTFSSMTSTRITSEFESHERAVMIAEAGQSAARTFLRGKKIDTLLAQSTTIPIYLDSTLPGTGSPALRNPRFPLEVRNIDFQNPPGVVTNRAVPGLLTPALGAEIVVGGYRGRYFAKLTDNADEVLLGLGANDPSKDVDGKVFLRVVGINRGMPDEVESHGSYFKNSVAVIETVLKRDMTFKLNSPLALYGTNVNAGFDGNSFTIDGFDHRGITLAELTKGNHTHDPDDEAFAGIGCLYDASGQGDAETAVDDLNTALSDQQDDNVTGAGGSPAVRDDTALVRDSENPDATNIFDPLFLLHFTTIMASVADYTFEDGTSLSGSGILLGTSEDPKITVAKGNLDVSGNGSGAGILIVQGKLNIQGAFDFDGVILVVGDGILDLGGANKAIAGGIYVANVSSDGTFGTPSLSISGKCDFFMKSDSIEMAYSLLPMRVIAWREITSEIEPN